MFKYRACFSREEQVKYISHLDLMKAFDRATRRANIKVSFSKGFNPHPQMVFGLPLSVGVTSDAEYMDIELDEDLECEELMKRLNNQLPIGLRIKSIKRKEIKDNIMASLNRARYKVKLKVEENTGIKWEEALLYLMGRDNLDVLKVGKKGEKYINIRPFIFELNILDQQEDFVEISMLVSAGSKDNLRPQTFVEVLEKEFCSKITILSIHRSGLYIMNYGVLLDPLDDRILKTS